MKKIILFTSFLIGGSIIASDLHYTERGKSQKRFSWNSTGPVGQVSIIIDKSDYELNVYDEKGWYATYPVVFGNNSLADKRMEGDKNTPEGSFKILNKRVHDKWCRFLSIDYPNEESRQKFNQRKQRGEIPANARIGGGIGIHGTWPHEDFVVDRYKNWTLGCISMKNDDVTELYGYAGSGTRVTIRK
ncbi:MAG TPA: L,D-transpeptidase [Chitinophagaceae bacterium]|jgi:murein L,D-transpeptidase YafK|nr:L,D-transpeptidase [Chitinophagaceae bacterium]HMU56967.1 L,D-transpeptidase [Chitinophagaceae bacterium]